MEKSTLLGLVVFLLIVLLGSLYYGIDFNSIKDKIPEISGKKTVNVYFEPVNAESKPIIPPLEDVTFRYWEDRENVDFVEVKSRDEADVVVKWIKEYSDNQLGNTFESKLVEIGYGDSQCIDKWFPYDTFTIEKVLKHELGHVLGKGHSNESNNIMYYQLPKTYSIKVSGFHTDGRYLSGGYWGDCNVILDAQSQGALVGN